MNSGLILTFITLILSKGDTTMAGSNKVKFGLKNCHYAVATETRDEVTGTWTTTYGTPKPLAGSVNISLSKEVAENIFRADDSAYYTTSKNNGYTGSYELAMIPSSALEEIFGQVRDASNFLVESESDKTKYVALLFEVDGDQKATKYCFFRVLLQKPNVEAETTGDTIEPKTDSCDLTVLPRLDDGRIKVMADDKTDAQKYADFYKAVPVITVSEG